MGANQFQVTVQGKTAKEAFKKAREEAEYEYGHGGYTGTIAEKSDFLMITCPKKNKTVNDYIYDLFEEGDERIDSKWGPAGCIKLNEDTWIFFGYASS